MKPLIFGLFALRAFSQAPPAVQQPPLIACGTSAGIDIICGTRSPEDLEVAPDGKSIIVSQFVTRGPGGGFTLFDPLRKSFSKLAIIPEPLPDWGDKSCPGPIGDAIGPHGTSVVKRRDGKTALLVVNHGGRESIEMFELTQTGPDLRVAWHGCVVSKQAFNDVGALPDGGFVATHPTAIQAQGQDLFAGAPSGYVVTWAPGKEETELPGTRFGYPNGVVVSKDGRYAFFAAWTGKEIHKYDLQKSRHLGIVRLDFMPDNITWTPKGKLLAAGVKGTRGDCPAKSGSPCIQGFGVAEIDPAKMAVREVFDSAGKGALISGVSVALELNGSVYVGSFQGDRILRFSR
jgi:hypothetical protein